MMLKIVNNAREDIWYYVPAKSEHGKTWLIDLIPPCFFFLLNFVAYWILDYQIEAPTHVIG